jgi:hypothetical protein
MSPEQRHQWEPKVDFALEPHDGKYNHARRNQRVRAITKDMLCQGYTPPKAKPQKRSLIIVALVIIACLFMGTFFAAVVLLWLRGY